MTVQSRWVTVRPWVALLARLGLAGVLGFAGLSKIGDPAGSVRAVAAYKLFGDSVNQVIGYALPFAELALALLLFAGLATRYTGALGACLFLAFLAGIASALARGLAIDCGCFGGGGAVAPGEEDFVTPLLRDLGFLALAGIVVAWPRSPLALDRMLDHDDTDTVRGSAEHG